MWIFHRPKWPLATESETKKQRRRLRGRVAMASLLLLVASLELARAVPLASHRTVNEWSVSTVVSTQSPHSQRCLVI